MEKVQDTQSKMICSVCNKPFEYSLKTWSENGKQVCEHDGKTSNPLPTYVGRNRTLESVKDYAKKTHQTAVLGSDGVARIMTKK